MLDLNEDTTQKFKSTYEKQKSLSNSDNELYILSTFDRYGQVISKFREINSRDIDFSSPEDRNQAALLDALEIIKSNKNDFQYVNTASTTEIMEIFSVFEQYGSKESPNTAENFASFVTDNAPYIGKIKDIFKIVAPQEYISEQLIEVISKREDAHIILPHMLEKLDKGYFSENAYHLLQDKFILNPDKYSRDQIVNIVKQSLKLSTSNPNNIVDKVKTEDSNNNDKQYSKGEAEEKIQVIKELVKAKNEAQEKYEKTFKKEELEAVIALTKSTGSELEKLGQWTDSKDLQRTGAAVGSLAVIGDSLTKIGVFTGAAQVSGFGLVFPAAAMVVGAITIFSILNSKKNNNNPSALAEIYDAMRILRSEMHEQFYIVNQKLFKIYETMHLHQYEILNRFDKIEDLIKFEISELTELMRENLILEGDKILTNFEMKKLPSSPEALEKNLETLSHLIYTLPKKQVLNGIGLYESSVESLKKKLELRKDPINSIGFFVKYADNSLGIKDLPSGSEIPNLEMFYSMSSVLTRLVMESLEHDQTANAGDKLVTQRNSEYIRNIFLKINEVNNNVIHTIKLLREHSVGKVIEQYKQAINDLSYYIESYNSDNFFKSLNEMSSALGEKNIDFFGKKRIGDIWTRMEDYKIKP